MIIAKDEIKKRFIDYNKLYFNNSLPMCKFSVLNQNVSAFGRYTHSYDKNKSIIGHIWISNKVNWTENALQEVIIHEMIHHYLYSIKHKCGGIFGHNWRFRKVCRYIKRNYNLDIHTHCFHLMYLRKKPMK